MRGRSSRSAVRSPRARSAGGSSPRPRGRCGGSRCSRRATTDRCGSLPTARRSIGAGPGADTTGSDGDLWLRRLDELDATRITGLNAFNAVFSPDGKEMAVATLDGKLTRVSLSGTTPRPLCDSVLVVGSWGEDGFIYFTHARLGVGRVPAAGGAPESLTELSNAAAYELHVLADRAALRQRGPVHLRRVARHQRAVARSGPWTSRHAR